MKKPHMRTIKGSSGKDCFNYFISTLWLLRLGFLKEIYSEWVKTPATGPQPSYWKNN